MLEKQESYTSIELKEFGKAQLRKTTRIIEDGNVLSESHHRQIKNPSDDVSDLPQHIQDVINAYWTQDVIDAWNELQQQTNEITN